MAKTKSSVQEELSSKTGIDMTAGLGFAPVNKEITVDKMVEQTKESTVEELKKEDLNSKKNQTKTTKSEKKTTKSKLQKPDSIDQDDEIHKISALISTKAKENLETYAKMYGYKKLSPFINDLFEHLDAYMDED